MSTTAIAAATSALWPAFRRMLRALGRWLLNTLRDKGVKFLLGVMRNRITKIAASIDKAIRYTAKAKPAMKLHGRLTRRRRERRLARWTKWTAWMMKNGKRFSPRVIRELEGLVKLGHSKLPLTAPWDRKE